MANYREYLIKDTVESIALYERGNVSNWREIVLINSLDFPFVVAEKETDILAVRNVFASGPQTFGVNAPVSTAINLPLGLILEVVHVGLRDIGDRAPRYYTTIASVLPAYSASTTVPIVCESSGDWGNTLANTIARMVEDGNGKVLLNTGVWVTKPAVDFTYNAADILNGKRRNIKTTGETILIPIGVGGTAVVPARSYAEDFGGIDLALDANGDFIVDFKTGDLATVSGYANIAQSLYARISTRRGELKRYPYYGSNLSSYVGRSGKYIKDLIKMDIIATFKQDERVEDVIVHKFSATQSALNIDSVDIKLFGRDQMLQLRSKQVLLS
jgi:hypothetical protein